jgi:hypothetical protein
MSSSYELGSRQNKTNKLSETHVEKFFKFVDRVNALAFFAGVLMALCLLLWMIGSSLWDNRAKTSVVVPNATEDKNQVLSLSAWEFIPEIGVQVLKLQSTGGEASEYASEGRGYKNRNLLFVKTDGGTSTWLFPDQSHLLSRIERLTTPDGRTKAIYFESRLVGEKSDPQFSIYMARPDGTSPVEVLKDVDQVLSRRISGDAAHFIYQSGLEIKETKISLTSFTSQSHGVVARMDMVRR